MVGLIRCVLVVSLAGVAFSGCSGGGGGSDGVISFTAASFSQNEDGTPTGLEMTLQRVGGSGEVSATVQFSNGTATGGVDYDPTPIVVTWLAGDLSDKTIVVPVVDDNIDEQPGETVDLRITNPTGGAVIGGQDVAVLTIVDDDDAGVIQFATSGYFFLEDGSGISILVAVTRTGGTDGFVTATVTMTDGGSGNAANSDPNSLVEPVDYDASPLGVGFDDGDATPKIVAIHGGVIIDDLLPELDETFQIHLTNPTGGVEIGPQGSALVTIVDQDDALAIPFAPAIGDRRFGSSVAKLGRFLMVGAPGWNGGNGTVFRLDPTDPSIIQDSYSGGPFTQNFGETITQDGSTFAVGGVGLVRLFDVNPLDTELTQRVDLESPKQGFGHALLGLGDGRFVVGAPETQLGGETNPSGSISVYDAATGALLQEIDGTGVARFGSSLARLGGSVAIGAPGGVDGSVHVLGGWPLALEAFVPMPTAHPDASFGAALAALPGNRLIVGAPTAFNLATPENGLFHAFEGGLFAGAFGFGATDFARFGTNLYHFESADRLCIFGPGLGTAASGMVVLYNTGPISFSSFLECPDPTPDARFGHAICEYDGVLVVGAPLQDFDPGSGMIVDAGVVYIVKLP